MEIISFFKKNNKSSIGNKSTVTKIVITCTLLIVSTATIFHISYKIDNKANAEVSFIIGSIKDIFQVLFFITAGTVTILSYIQAKKTLFTPIKTETFKIQIKAFEDILAFFQNKTETNFTDQFDLNFILHGNSQLLVNEYLIHFFKDQVKINEDKILELQNKFSGAIATHSYAEKYFQKNRIL